MTNTQPNAKAPADAHVSARFGHALSIAGTLISRLATLAVLILLPKEIGLTDYGLFALVITVGEMIEMTSSNWYRLLLVRLSVNADSSQPAVRDERGVTIAAGLLVSAGIALLAALAISPVVAGQERASFTLAVACYIVAFIVFRLLITMLQSMGRQNLIGIAELLRGVLTIAFVAGAIHFGGRTFIAASHGLIVATALTALICLPAIRQGLGPLLRQRLEAGSFVSIGVPVVIATILTFQLGWLDRLVIQHWLGPQSVGLYVAVIAIARQPIDLVLNALNSQTFPILMARGADFGPKATRHMTGVLVSACIIGLGCAMAIIALADPLTRFALPAFGRDTVLLLTPMIALGAFALGLKHFVFDNIFHAHGRNWVMLRWFALVSVATLALSLVLVPLYGVTGAAIGFMAGSFASLVSSVYLSRQFCPVAWPVGTLLRILVSAVGAGLLAWLSVQFDATPLLRLLAGSLVFAIAYVALLSVILRFRIFAFLAAPWNIDGLRGTAS